jgi:RNA polymerase sigma factor (sigma-70 family)
MDSEEEQLGSLLPLAYSIAHRYERMWHQPMGEYETAALMGAWDAVKRWDPDTGASLKTYARFRIQGEIVDWHRKEMQQQGGSRREHMRNVVRCVDFNDLGINGDGYMSEASIIEKMEQGKTVEKGYNEIINHDMLMHLKTRMDEKEWDIMIRCVCNEEFMKDVGKDYGVSESRICQILPVALRHARRIIEEMQCEPKPMTPDQISQMKDHDREMTWIAKIHGQGDESAPTAS